MLVNKAAHWLKTSRILFLPFQTRPKCSDFGFKLIKGNGRALNANRFSLPVIRYFTVALQYRCPLALNTNVGSSFWALPPFSRKLAQIHTICQSLDTPPCDWKNWLSSIEYLVRAVPLIEPGNHCHPSITAWLTTTAILLNDGEISAASPERGKWLFKGWAMLKIKGRAAKNKFVYG
jgi:hypothetical protein